MSRALLSALEWHIESGVDEALAEEPVNRCALQKEPPKTQMIAQTAPAATAMSAPNPQPLLGASEAYQAALALAQQADNLDVLKKAIAEFDGLALKQTATNMVFCDGNPAAPVMLVGEAPGADEDRLGRPFVGVSGQLLDVILAAIDRDRKAAEPDKALYISNILNWRPPGNRTPAPGEIEVSLPFIEKHIALVKPKLLILCGGVSAKALLGTTDGISRLRGRWHDYKPQSPGIGEGLSIPAIATYHPAYLLRTPAQKRAVWQDMLCVQQKLRDL